MLIRTVRMTLRPDALDHFLSLVDRSPSRIRSFPGCSRLDLWMDVSNPSVMTTATSYNGADSP
ncbi:MAG: antibiotic biosynthesis monooxygenase [Bacteroidetes bacterium]|nr:antibiotic biosynthesis monooxygenase [Bacteroidota bacterium]